MLFAATNLRLWCLVRQVTLHQTHFRVVLVDAPSTTVRLCGHAATEAKFAAKKSIFTGTGGFMSEALALAVQISWACPEDVLCRVAPAEAIGRNASFWSRVSRVKFQDFLQLDRHGRDVVSVPQQCAGARPWPARC